MNSIYQLFKIYIIIAIRRHNKYYEDFNLLNTTVSASD